MPGVWVSTIRESAGRAQGRLGAFVVRQPGWAARAAILAGLLVAALLAMLVVLPMLIVATVVFLAAAGWAGLRRTWSRLTGRGPGGRRNVRIVVREAQGP
jgi:hypothetical protein